MYSIVRWMAATDPSSSASAAVPVDEESLRRLYVDTFVRPEVIFAVVFLARCPAALTNSLKSVRVGSMRRKHSACLAACKGQFSRFLRYRLDIQRHNSGIRVCAIRRYLYNRPKSRVRTDGWTSERASERTRTRISFCSWRTDDGASTERGESGKISRPRDQTE